MKQILQRRGKIVVEDVPAPRAEAGTVVVRVDHSCISIGTELSGIRRSAMPLWQRALRQPENVRKVFEMLGTQGVERTWHQVHSRLSKGQAMGYSAAGTIVEVGAGVTDLCAGDRVACAGSECAFHAEFIRVPRNLAVPIPAGVSFADASTVALGAIALQGVRRAQPTIGEAFVVVGLGAIGQITTQLLTANGCQVIVVDLDRDRIDLALKRGAAAGVHPDDADHLEHVARMTDGFGADGVIVTAASASDAVISSAFKMCRKKGRVILVGDVGLNLNRSDFYEKELDFLISTSYGPGRYDHQYEEAGLDYPLPYVRWTENRNMAEYLRLLSEGRVDINNLPRDIAPIDEAGAVYGRLQDGAVLLGLLHYPGPARSTTTLRLRDAVARVGPTGRIPIALAGAGSFAKSAHLPNLHALSDLYHLQAVMSHTGHNAVDTARDYGADYTTTDYAELLADATIQAILIATRHDLHAPLALRALQAGKHVLVEKPLALNQAELDQVEAFYAQGTEAKPLLLTGFNRRFSPYARRLHELVANRSNPMILCYRMNAGHIPREHWVHGPEGGGRNVGEACHIYDLFTYLIGSRVKAVEAKAVRPATEYYLRSDNFSATTEFEDGSIATLIYTALGASEYPKEQLEVYVDGKVIVLDDYKHLHVHGAKIKGMETRNPEKGLKEELEAFATVLRHGGEWPIPLWQQIQAMRIAFMVEEQISMQGA